MRCKKCSTKIKSFMVHGGFKVYTCPKCSALQAYTPWELGGKADGGKVPFKMG